MTLVTIAIVLAAGAVLGLLALRTPRILKARDTFYTNRHSCDFSLPLALRITIDEELFGAEYPSQIGQDKWLLYRMFPGVTDGFFLDVGSADGTIRSNSKALEARGWTGICVDPFPGDTTGRTAQVFREVVWSTAGHTVQFHAYGEMGGVTETLGAFRDQATAAPVVTLQTVTLGDILERGRAPAFIHYLSLDVEGAELEALRGIPFDRYRFGAMTIEHNNESGKRARIVEFLAERGYQLVLSSRQDDFFAPVRQSSPHGAAAPSPRR
jgi:FkbM family methyltransferase